MIADAYCRLNADSYAKKQVKLVKSVTRKDKVNDVRFSTCFDLRIWRAGSGLTETPSSIKYLQVF
jgi:hypothetical protein